MISLVSRIIIFLDDHEKNELKRGNYEDYNFEEEELEDDDYYFDDGKNYSKGVIILFNFSFPQFLNMLKYKLIKKG